MKSYLVLVAGLAFAAVAACGGSTGNTGLTAASPDAGDDAGDTTGTDDGGTGTTNYNTPTTCTSGATWTGGDRGSSRMHPGVACIDCHDQNGGPSLTVAGTVFPTAHEPDDCNGANGTTLGLTVVITDKNGQTYKLPVNSAGNFYSVANIATPYAAKVVQGTKERAMVQHQTSGDCNSCHTVAGANGAPGRIMAP